MGAFPVTKTKEDEPVYSYDQPVTRLDECECTGPAILERKLITSS
jgi:hypothetical protein